jgi:hypothetical protein
MTARCLQCAKTGNCSSTSEAEAKNYICIT